MLTSWSRQIVLQGILQVTGMRIKYKKKEENNGNESLHKWHSAARTERRMIGGGWSWYQGTVGVVVRVTWPERGPWRLPPALSARRPDCSPSLSAGWYQTGPHGCRRRRRQGLRPQTTALLNQTVFHTGASFKCIKSARCKILHVNSKYHFPPEMSGSVVDVAQSI